MHPLTVEQDQSNEEQTDQSNEEQEKAEEEKPSEEQDNLEAGVQTQGTEQTNAEYGSDDATSRSPDPDAASKTGQLPITHIILLAYFSDTEAKEDHQNAEQRKEGLTDPTEKANEQEQHTNAEEESTSGTLR